MRCCHRCMVVPVEHCHSKNCIKCHEVAEATRNAVSWCRRIGGLRRCDCFLSVLPSWTGQRPCQPVSTVPHSRSLWEGKNKERTVRTGRYVEWPSTSSSFLDASDNRALCIVVVVVHQLLVDLLDHIVQFSRLIVLTHMLNRSVQGKGGLDDMVSAHRDDPNLTASTCALSRSATPTR
jgi:hypothetical protein